MAEKKFKQCSLCKHNWSTRDDLLNDPSVSFIGYQANFNELLLGFFLFNHKCRTTIAIPVNKFHDLYVGHKCNDIKIGGQECPGYCINKEELSPCKENCKFAWVRELMQIIKIKKNIPEPIKNAQECFP